MALVNAPYALTLLSEYTHTLDSLPLDLSRNFADLRELDAVLSSSILSITTKIHNLTTMIEEDTASKEDRLWLLTEIAEDAQRLKLGGEDKIRVACQAADNLKGHSSHLRALSEHIPGFDTSVLSRATIYPHVSERAYMPAMTMETGRRRRGGYGSLLVANNPDPSPAKRKRVVKDDDIDVGTGRSPKKPAGGEGNPRARNNGRAKKNERAVSPSESLVSVTSHLPPQIGPSTSARGGANGRAGNGAGNNKRARAGANNANRNPTPLANEVYSGNHDSRRGTAADNFPPSTSHPSLPLPYQNGHASGAHTNGYDAHGLQHIPGAQNWAIPPAQQLEAQSTRLTLGTAMAMATTGRTVSAMA
ncbi:hypothetical protein NLJ89_g5245 [Agrocybe chaxingu]|uniref:Inhibitor of growth protein N-terminal histone-binding domain-containing protein n=1 Tax=Agrocybe chaxingu TaxID=84603 RepID=A0A9W8MX25_9AGAR|nr:hypothetical protein NLJ89_g5245 [Agrocybe chaxingu]